VRKLIAKMIKALFRSTIFLCCITLIVGGLATLYETFIYDLQGRAVVMLKHRNSGGTGFQISAPSGTQYTLTNAHVCALADELDVYDNNQKELQRIKVIKVYKEHDLCIMESVKDLPSLKLADSIIPHERVWLVGFPALRPLTLESGHFVGKMTISVIEECKLRPKEYTYDKETEDMINLLMNILLPCFKKYEAQHINNISYGGNSGSPVLNKWGNVIGILFAGDTRQPTASYTVPLEVIKEFLSDK